MSSNDSKENYTVFSNTDIQKIQTEYEAFQEFHSSPSVRIPEALNFNSIRQETEQQRHNEMLAVIHEVIAPLEQQAESAEKQAMSAKQQVAALESQHKELKRQADSQNDIFQLLEQESVSRAADDKKYFWLGTLVSFLISMTVEHGAAMIQFLQQLFQ